MSLMSWISTLIIQISLSLAEHLEGQLALGVVAAQELAVNALFSVEEPAVRFHVQQVRRRVL